MSLLTIQAIHAFDACRGVVEQYVAATGHQPDLREWGMINLLIGDMILLRSGRATEQLRAQLKARIDDAVEGEAVFLLLAAIADRKIGANSLQG
ncbi:hypothetical protein DLD77_00225 [Chitinophaga alhagiae]|uniref:Uncharacterized protein n=1 Tax=Chitinophaga alhagiae TaxID=2203219 RepID=A0ABM6W8G7_9BACT|nr:hypothetical protein [Chitinophaga alhagiae]AWO00240.1 hypothetical protein DLD77_00225 [Chitinophaga alhagiae]